MSYRLLIDYEVIEFLETLPRKDRQLLRNCFVAIQDYPRTFPITPRPKALAAALTSTSAANMPSSIGRIPPTGI